LYAAGAVAAPGTTSPGDPCTTQTLATENDCTSITLPAVGPEGSTFLSTPILITVYNASSYPVFYTGLQFTDSSNNGIPGEYLADEMSTCLYSDGFVTYNGTLPAAEALGNMLGGGEIGAGSTDTYTVVFYAGTENTGCGTLSGNMIDAWATGGIANVDGGAAIAWPQSSPVSNAASLDNNAEGGSDTVSVTWTYSDTQVLPTTCGSLCAP
jgi:hypothetical protein